jgi:O-antigen/teichoic acid export membrane protein
MSRTRKAAAAAGFGYLQYALAIVTGIFLVPLTLRSLGARTWGVWLASGEVLSYAGMADLGVLGVLPWMLAEAEGRRDRAELSTLLSQGVWLGAGISVVYAALALVLWHFLPFALFLTSTDRSLVGPPLALAVLVTTVSYPLGAYRALITGVQDVFFNGVLTLAQAALGALLTVVLLIRGYGLYALVWALAGPSLLGLIASFVRSAWIAPDVVWRFSPPRPAYIRRLLTNGLGGWLSALGWQLLAASNGIVITYMGHPEWVPVYACTAKLAAMCMQLGWVLPDSGHVGLAQLHGEQTSTARVRQVVLMMQRLHLLTAGVIACGLLVFNPAFVTRWVGAAVFGGLSLNVLLALGVLLHSFTHGLVTSAAVIGNRPRVGVLVLVNGLVQTPLAIFLGHRFGLIGVASAGLVAAATTMLPGGIALLRPHTVLGVRGLMCELVAPWAMRGMPLVLVAGVVGAFYQTLGLWLSGIAAAVICLAYLWQMRPLCTSLPIDARWTDWLVRWRILPPALPIPANLAAAIEKT